MAKHSTGYGKANSATASTASRKLEAQNLCRQPSVVAIEDFRGEHGAGHTLDEAGQQFSVTCERIRQIEAKALRKLKHPSWSRKMRSFLDQ